MASPAGHSRGPERAVVAHRRPARRRLRRRRPRRTLARGRQRAGSEGRTARRHRGDRARPLLRASTRRCSHDFRATGLYHCLAVDGSKVAAVGGGIAAVVLFLGFGSYVAQIAALLTVAGTRSRSGSIRRWCGPRSPPGSARSRGSPDESATAGRRCSSARALLLGWNPYLALRRRVPALVRRRRVDLRASRLASCGRSRATRCSHGLAQLIGVSTACGLATAPVTWFQFHQISLVTVPANVVAVPVVVEVLGLALLTAVVAPFAPSVAAAMAQLNGWGAWFVAGCARAFASIPGAQVTSPRAAAVLGLGAVGAAAYAWQRGERARAEAGLPPDWDRPAEDRGGAPAAARTDR